MQTSPNSSGKFVRRCEIFYVALMEISAGLLIDWITIRRIRDCQPVAIKMSTINNIEKTNSD